MQLPAEQFLDLALEALCYELTVNAENISTVGEKEYLSRLMSLGRGLSLLLGYNTASSRRLELAV